MDAVCVMPDYFFVSPNVTSYARDNGCPRRPGSLSLKRRSDSKMSKEVNAQQRIKVWWLDTTAG